MKILFIYPDLVGTGKDWCGMYNHGIGLLSAALKKEGYEVSLLHITKPITKDEFIDCLNRQQPDIVAFSTTTNLFRYVKDWSKWTKEHSEAIVICGGIHPTLVPEEVIKEESIDAICIREGEYALVEFCKYLEKSIDNKHIKGIWLKEDGRIYKGSPRPLYNLDELPFPDKSIFDYGNLTLGREGCGIFMASKGCPYKCTYCCNEALRESADTSEQAFVRFKSVDYIIAEIEDELTKYPFINVIGFDDDILPLKLDWFEEFVRQYKKNIHLPMACNLRPNLATKERFKLIKEAGCIHIMMGIEAGNDFIRNKILKRNLSQEQIINAFSLCEEAGIKTFSYNMIGLPFENVFKMLETVKMNAQVKVDMCQMSIFYPYPKTELYDLCKRENLITNRYSKLGNIFTDTPLNFSLIERNQIRFIQRFFRVLVIGYRFIFSLPDKTSKVCIKIYDSFLSSRVTAILIYPVLLKVYQAMRSTKITNKVGRWVLRNILENPSRKITIISQTQQVNVNPNKTSKSKISSHKRTE